MNIGLMFININKYNVQLHASSTCSIDGPANGRMSNIQTLILADHSSLVFGYTVHVVVIFQHAQQGITQSSKSSEQFSCFASQYMNLHQNWTHSSQPSVISSLTCQSLASDPMGFCFKPWTVIAIKSVKTLIWSTLKWISVKVFCNILCLRA